MRGTRVGKRPHHPSRDVRTDVATSAALCAGRRRGTTRVDGGVDLPYLLQPAFALILGLAPTLDHASLALLCHDVSATPQQLGTC